MSQTEQDSGKTDAGDVGRGGAQHPALAGAVDGRGRRADDRQPDGDAHHVRARGSRAGDRMTSPVTVPSVENRAGSLAALGWTGRDAVWIALVCLHSGVFTRSQWCYFFDDQHRMPATRFIRQLVDRGAGPRPGRVAVPDVWRGAEGAETVCGAQVSCGRRREGGDVCVRRSGADDR